MINKENNFEKGINVLHKEQIIIDGVEYNPCNGCKLWNGHHCIGARSYEPNADKHRAICNEHIANQFHKVYQQLYRKTQECEELKESNKKAQELYKYFMDVAENTANKNKELENNLHIANTNHEAAEKECDRYLEALEEIEDFRKKHCDFLCEGNRILYIINKAKGEGKCQ